VRTILTGVDDPAIDGPLDLQEYRRAWQLRRDLAELSVRPEGFYFRWRASDNRIYGATLITPPDMEAVQRGDGTWFRTRRIINAQNPVPYSEQWYAEYLHHFGLPTYFLRLPHLSMMDDNLESQMLGMHNAPSPQYAVIPRNDYLELRYSATPSWPRQDPNRIYRLELRSEGERAGLARHHPALSITEFPYRTYVWPNGHVQLRSMIQQESWGPPVRTENDVPWDEFEEGSRVLSHYHREATGIHPHSQPVLTRDARVQSAIDHHAIVNPMEVPPGRGDLLFLSADDERDAIARGYVDAQGNPDPTMVTRARINGQLAVGVGPNAGPIIVFWPNPANRNPAVDPTGPGAWRFLTNDGDTSNRGLAAINFGGSHGLPTYPTASQIRRLGQLFVRDGRQNLADMIDVVWVPGQVDAAPGVDPVLDGNVETEEDEASFAASLSSPAVSRRGSGTIRGADPNEDPTNGNPGGNHDQTGGPWAEYETVAPRGIYITVDRSRAWLGKPEPHKLWCYGARGWKKWPRWKGMDWNAQKWVTDLNKHREQTNQRANLYEAKRAEKRVDYTQQELEWVMDLVRDAGGQRPEQPLANIAAEFNRRFSAQRNHTGIQSLVDRLRKEFVEHGGLKPRKGRGWMQQEASKQLRGVGSSVLAHPNGESGDEKSEKRGEEAGEKGGDGGEGGGGGEERGKRGEEEEE
jgi:hypothetical protein